MERRAYSWVTPEDNLFSLVLSIENGTNIYSNKRSGSFCPWSGLLSVSEFSRVRSPARCLRSRHPGACIRRSKYGDLIAKRTHVIEKYRNDVFCLCITADFGLQTRLGSFQEQVARVGVDSGSSGSLPT